MRNAVYFLGGEFHSGIRTGELIPPVISRQWYSASDIPPVISRQLYVTAGDTIAATSWDLIVNLKSELPMRLFSYSKYFMPFSILAEILQCLYYVLHHILSPLETRNWNCSLFSLSPPSFLSSFPFYLKLRIVTDVVSIAPSCQEMWLSQKKQIVKLETWQRFSHFCCKHKFGAITMNYYLKKKA